MVNILKRTLFSAAVLLSFLFSPIVCLGFTFEEPNLNFDFIFEVPILPTTSYYPLYINATGNTGLTLENLYGLDLTLSAGLDPEKGLLAGEKVKEGFLLLDGTLAIDVSPTNPDAGGRAAIRSTYRMDVNPEALGRGQIRTLIRAQLGRIGARAGARADGRVGMSHARLMRFVEDENGGTWKRAVRAIRAMGRAEIRARGNSVPDGVLGHYGYVQNSEENYVWAVMDTNSKYAVGVSHDADGDGFRENDNCPEIANADQADLDGDGLGDVCDDDVDGDGSFNISDNCPTAANSGQEDYDADGLGDICDSDDDNDSVEDSVDNCPFGSNAEQTDTDLDGLGDFCDDDPDGDGVIEGDNCPDTPNPLQEDNEGDGLGDACDTDDDNDGVADNDDNCPTIYNSSQDDFDGDSIGDVCDADVDGDGTDNEADNCPLTANTGQDDTDDDGQGDACDSDDDNDGVIDEDDNCPLMWNLDQSNVDGDYQGDVCDGDLDGDGVTNEIDNCPDVANNSQTDFDGDGVGDTCDEDIDGDDVVNGSDLCSSTIVGSIVDSDSGCSLDQLCPCDTPRGRAVSWKNHGKYVSCMAKSSESFVEMGLISENDKEVIVSEAAQSECPVK